MGKVKALPKWLKRTLLILGIILENLFIVWHSDENSEADRLEVENVLNVVDVKR